MSNIKYNIPENVYQGRQEENRKLFRKARNSAMNNVFSKYGIPKNMGNKEIKRRVKYHNWFARKTILYHRTFRNRKLSNNKYIEFLMNDKVFNENKRKSLVILSLELHNGAVIAVRSPVVVSYLVKLVNLLPTGYIVKRDFTRQLKSFGKFREDAAMIAMLKKRINFLRKLSRLYDDVLMTINLINNLRPVLDRLKINVSNATNNGEFLSYKNLNRLMDDMFPIPPHPKGNTAAKTIQKRARGMINRTTVKKMKTVAGRVSLRGKR
jgi:hypothetical protein